MADKPEQLPLVRGWHPLGNWSLNPPKGYPRFVSGPFLGEYVHRVIWRELAQRPIPEGFHIHHQDFDRTNFRPENLVCMPAGFNRRREIRCPFTGQFLSAEEWLRRFGVGHGSVAA